MILFSLKRRPKYEQIIRLKINKNKIIKERYANFLKYTKGTKLGLTTHLNQKIGPQGTQTQNLQKMLNIKFLLIIKKKLIKTLRF